MSAGAAQSGHSSAAGRLVARSRRAAVRSRESLFGIPTVEIVEAQVPGALEPPRPEQISIPPPSPSGLVRVQPPRVPSAPEPVPPATVVPSSRVDAPEPAHDPPRSGREPAALPGDAGAPRPAALEAQLHEVEPGLGGLPVWTFAGPASPGARSSPVDSPTGPVGRPPEGDPPKPVAEQLQTYARAAEPTPHETPQVHRVEPARDELLATPRAPTRTAASTAVGRRSDADPPLPAPAGPPQVLIDRIEVITPPARPQEPDPFRSLAAQRSGASRHERARWRG